MVDAVAAVCLLCSIQNHLDDIFLYVESSATASLTVALSVLLSVASGHTLLSLGASSIDYSVSV